MTSPPDTLIVPDTDDKASLSREKHQDQYNVVLSPEKERKLWRKIDIHLLPIISLMYLFSFMDRGE